MVLKQKYASRPPLHSKLPAQSSSPAAGSSTTNIRLKRLLTPMGLLHRPRTRPGLARVEADTCLVTHPHAAHITAPLAALAPRLPGLRRIAPPRRAAVSAGLAAARAAALRGARRRRGLCGRGRRRLRGRGRRRLRARLLCRAMLSIPLPAHAHKPGHLSTGACAGRGGVTTASPPR